MVRTARHALAYDAGPTWSADSDSGQRIVVTATASGIRMKRSWRATSNAAWTLRRAPRARGAKSGGSSANSKEVAPAVIASLGLGLTARVRQPTIVMVGEHDTETPLDPVGRGAFALLDGPRFLVELPNTGHCAFAVGCVAAACGAGCEPTALPLEQAHKFTLRYAVPFFLRYVRGRDLFPRALRPGDAPDGVVVLEAHAHGERPRR